MDIFLELLVKLLPIYMLMILGYIAGKYLRVQKEAIANVLVYILSPVVIFFGVLNTKLSVGTLSIPILFFGVSCVVAGLMYILSGIFWKDTTRNTLAYIAGSSNSGFFGIPVVVAIFGPDAIGLAALAVIGTTLYLNTVGFFIAAKGEHSSRESVLKVLKMPIIYAFSLGLLAQAVQIQPNETYLELANNFNGAFIILGMMLVGIGLSEIKKIKMDLRFISFAFFSKFIVWPFIVSAIILVDSWLFGIYDQRLQQIIFILAFVPIAGNIVAYTAILKSHPEKSALAVFLTTIFALVLIPAVAVIAF